MLTHLRDFSGFYIIGCIILCSSSVLAHNGSVTLAYPVDHIKIDGDLSDWSTVKKQVIGLNPSDVKPRDGRDCSAYFQISYSIKDQSLYVAIEVNDDDYIKDTSRQVRWNTQDAAEIYLDMNHNMNGSAVASYLYSETFKNINGSIWDPIAKLASWENVEIIMKRLENITIYEWKFKLGDQIVPGRTIGFDVNIFDKDQDGFSWICWGKGDSKFRNPNALGDVLLMKKNEPTSDISGQAQWNNETIHGISIPLRISATVSSNLWISAAIDSTGRYSAILPKGKYTLSLADEFLHYQDKIYKIALDAPSPILVPGKPSYTIPVIHLTADEAPDLIPSKGVLFSFNKQTPKVIDDFIRTYQSYYNIPGVSLALIKDGAVVYHQVYGVKNTITKEPVDENTLFEAASVTKPVFSYAVQRLAERGVIDLDKPLFLYLPFKDIEYDDRYKLITARHVLTHRSGFPNWRNGKLVINFTPGTQYNYSGEGMQYLQAVVEKITGKGIEQVLKEEVLDPIGLFHTYFSKNDSLAKLVSTGHYDNIPSTDGLPEQPGMAYSMHTEANVFTRFMLQLLNQKGLSAATYDNMLSERSLYPYPEGEEKPKYKEYMGESLAVRDSPFGLAFGHGGNNGDFRCQFELYKDLKMGYVIFTNSSTAYPLIEKMKSFLIEGKE